HGGGEEFPSGPVRDCRFTDGAEVAGHDLRDFGGTQKIRLRGMRGAGTVGHDGLLTGGAVRPAPASLPKDRGAGPFFRHVPTVTTRPLNFSKPTSRSRQKNSPKLSQAAMPIKTDGPALPGAGPSVT